MGFLWGGKTKKCEKCRREIDVYATKCPYCLSKQNELLFFSRFGCLGGSIVIIVIIIIKYDNESLPDITYGNDSGEKSHSEGFVNNDDVSISNNEVNNETINNIEEEERVVEETSKSTLSKKEARQQKKEDRKSDRQRRKENSKKESDGE